PRDRPAGPRRARGGGRRSLRPRPSRGRSARRAACGRLGGAPRRHLPRPRRGLGPHRRRRPPHHRRAAAGTGPDPPRGATERMTTTNPTGRVLLVGAGPGDPRLLTLAARDALAAAHAVVTARLVPLTSIDEHAPRAEVVHVGKIPRGAFTPQERIHELLLEHARAGRTVVRLKGGDGYLFGRGGEEWQVCTAAGIPVEVVPGVS